MKRRADLSVHHHLLLKTTPENIILIGQALIRQKAALGHGNYLKWIGFEFDMHEQSARRFVHVAEIYGGKSNKLLDLKPSAIYELAAPSTPIEVREEIERRIAAGELEYERD